MMLVVQGGSALRTQHFSFGEGGWGIITKKTNKTFLRKLTPIKQTNKTKFLYIIASNYYVHKT